MLEIVLRPQARADLMASAGYTKTAYGEAQARRYIEDIRHQIEFACGFPGIGSDAFGLPPLYRKLQSGSHHILYRCTTTELVVVRVILQREDVPDEIEDF